MNRTAKNRCPVRFSDVPLVWQGIARFLDPFWVQVFEIVVRRPDVGRTLRSESHDFQVEAFLLHHHAKGSTYLRTPLGKTADKLGPLVPESH